MQRTLWHSKNRQRPREREREQANNEIAGSHLRAIRLLFRSGEAASVGIESQAIRVAFMGERCGRTRLANDAHFSSVVLVLCTADEAAEPRRRLRAAWQVRT